MTAATSRAEATRRIAARNRRDFHLDRIRTAKTLRSRIWAIGGWLVAEMKLLDTRAQAEEFEHLIAVARELNERNAS